MIVTSGSMSDEPPKRPQAASSDMLSFAGQISWMTSELGRRRVTRRPISDHRIPAADGDLNARAPRLRHVHCLAAVHLDREFCMPLVALVLPPLGCSTDHLIEDLLLLDNVSCPALAHVHRLHVENILLPVLQPPEAGDASF